MPIVLTLTANPAVDISTSVARVEPTRKLRCSAESRDPGGGGINVARVTGRLGARSVAIYPAGGLVGQRLESLVRREGVESVVVPVQGETREDLTVLDETTHEEYRFVLPGPHLHDAEWMRCLKVLANVDFKPDFVCASGSLPPGAPQDFYARVAEIVESRGVPFALDTSGPALQSALRERVHLIKPNLAELRELVGGALDEDRSLIGACRTLIAGGRTEIVALTLGAQGALLVTAASAWRAQPLPIRPLSTVGAGDSFLGAMVWALASKLSLEEAFRYGAAAGAAALLAPGTDLCDTANVRRFLPQVVIEPVEESSTAA
ncbi:MAG: 1-phosphofructokinase family hexose kinase [Phenylobacterium sp.]|uniref:1-phosphofructokinase family hexose kinase n=1 Tax=Phenylobacterium sp. TaxID=1871053 RepID=UPI001225E995|nr:1-phosphofructokinase family hexose kinase [Phenylobacterium sp.]TAJ73922.1 MAG: 1-phosphofructokinase family hexose kinase [Phenylobacterium sp.]